MRYGRFVRDCSITPEKVEEMQNSQIISMGWLIRDPRSPYSGIVQQLRRKGLDGTGMTVAVLDSGINPNHPMLRGRVFGVSAYDFNDDYGHGSGQASIIAGAPWADPETQWIGEKAGLNREIIHEGVAPGANLLSIKILDHEGIGTLDEMAKGILTAARMGVDAINISGGSGDEICVGTSCQLCRAIMVAHYNSILVFAATGNERNKMACPAKHKHAIAIGAETIDGKLAVFSGRTRNGWAGDLLGPGGGEEMRGMVEEEWLVVGSSPFGTMHKDWDDLGQWMQAMRGSSPATAFWCGVGVLLLQWRRSLGETRAQAYKMVWKMFKSGQVGQMVDRAALAN